MWQGNEYSVGYTSSGLDRLFFNVIGNGRTGSFIEYGEFAVYDSASKLFDRQGWKGFYVFDPAFDDALIRFDRSVGSVFVPESAPHRADAIFINPTASLTSKEFLSMIRRVKPTAFVTPANFQIDDIDGYVAVIRDGERDYYVERSVAGSFRTVRRADYAAYRVLDETWLATSSLEERKIPLPGEERHIPTLRSLKDTVKSALRELVYLSKAEQSPKTASQQKVAMDDVAVDDGNVRDLYERFFMELSRNSADRPARRSRYYRKLDLMLRRMPGLVLREGYATFRRKIR